MRHSWRLLVLPLLPLSVWAQQTSTTVTAAVDRPETFLGELVTLQIVVDGADKLDREPALPGGGDFAAELRNAGPSTSQSITIVNGRRTEQVQRRYVLVYRLIPQRIGNLVIAPMQIDVGGDTLATAPIPILVREPVPIDEYRVMLELDRSRLWLGEAATLTTWWLWRPDYGPSTLSSFTHPVLTNQTAVLAEDLPLDPSSDNRVRLTVAGREVIALRTGRSLDGEDLIGLRFDTLLIPQQTGRLAIPAAVVAFEGVSGYRAGRDFFGRSVRQKLTDRFVVPSNPLTLAVDDVPASGRPANFSGLTGSFRLLATAQPLEVKVGDPIDLTITLVGRGNLHAFTLPELGSLPGFDAFRVGRRGGVDAPAQAGASERIFQRTLRALHTDVAVLPAIELAIFDTNGSTYDVIRSDPIPLQVEDTRQVTLADVEHTSDETTRDPVSIRSTNAGIAHNYAGPGLTVDQRYDPLAALGSPFGIAALTLAPLLFLAAGLHPSAARLLSRMRHVSHAGSGAPGRPRTALVRLRRELAATEHADGADLHLALLRYTRARLSERAAASTDGADASEVRRLESRMTDTGVTAAIAHELSVLVAALERVRYGGAGDADVGALAARVTAWADKLDATLRSQPNNRGGAAI